MAKVNFKRYETDLEAEESDFVDGNFIATKEGQIYLDYDEKRFPLIHYSVPLLAVSANAPSECLTGDKYFNITTNKIYTATGTNTWGATGEDAIEGIFYIVFDKQESYAYNGTTLVSVGGGAGAGGETLQIGTILPYSGTTAPDNYMICDGSAISRTTYSTLFDVIGTTFGSGDGSTTFNLPNLKGRVPVGLDSNDTDFDTIGETGGEKKHTLTVGEMPSGVEVLKYVSQANTWGLYVNNTPYQLQTQGGQGQAHNNLQPYQVVNYIIKVAQTTPVQAEVVNAQSNSTQDAYSCNYVNTQLNNIANTIPKTESGVIKGNQMTSYTLGSETYSYYNLTFSNTYTNAPTVVACIWTSNRAGFGIEKVMVANVSTTDCELCLSAYVNTASYGISYLVISND